MNSTRTRRANRRDANIAASLMLAPAVIALRMPILALEAASPFHESRPESVRAATEKTMAIADGLVAAQIAWWRAAWTLPLAMMRGSDLSVPLSNMAGAVASAALRPTARRVRHNLTRLSRG